MKKIVLCLLLTLCLAPIAELSAHADSGSAVTLVDAGIAPDAASTPAPVAPTLAIDPSNPLASATSAWDLVKQSGWLWGGMAVLFALGTYVIKKNDTSHWLGNDHILSIGTTVLGVLGAVINAHFGAGSWAAVIPVLVAGIALIIQKPKVAG